MEPIEQLRDIVKDIEKMKNQYELRIKTLKQDIRDREKVITEFKQITTRLHELEVKE